ncbi:bifunctional 2-polyprenyl-6-hydroxyphenol methylase/3-demethylubiquinol 3-O-methyltransferase UbiG [Motiliproteus sp. SC1-56]|uniref:class I SAM-dependent methyltransferase n=1 Tax=Motiliproteus sp. SC1-56 TaxID=2799565 RepID=UPI001A8D8EFA|nr:class I SAM-dependent methyltransferase [Motiliproteus sp. SC1-56]
MRWDRRYQEAEAPNSPARVLVCNLHLLPPKGDALELACGLGGNALALARHGLSTQAWDLSPVAVDKVNAFAAAEGLPLAARVVDLEASPLPSGAFDVICVSRYLERALCPAIVEALRPGGLLFYQTFTRQRLGTSGPDNPAFRLAPGELLRLFAALEPLVYREDRDCGDTTQGLRDEAYLVARRP